MSVRRAKPCTVCGIEKSFTEFYKTKRTKDGRKSECKTCTLAGMTEFYKKNSLRIREKTKWAKKLSNYGVTREQYEQMFSEQEGKCGCCQKPLEFAGRHTCMDHDHVTGQVRDLVCIHCNTMIGMAGDSIDRLCAGVDYLVKHSRGG